MLFQIVETVEMIDGMVEEIVGEMTDGSGEPVSLT
jgi:hypothetical protein